jgi:hemoglobin/transferrin/lactoferrin receptor protein
MITRHYCAALLACAAFFSVTLSPQFTQAQDAGTSGAEESATKLKKLTVKGDRIQQGSVADTPLATEITQEQLTDKQVTSFDDIGRSVDAGVNYSRADAGFNLRGLSGPRIVTLVDGIPIPYLSNSARQGAFAPSNANGGADTFDFDSLSSLDIVRGADSSRAGSGMLGGAIVINTLEPEDLIPEGRDWGAIFKSTYDTEDQSIAGSAAIAKEIENTSVLFQGGYRRGHERNNNGDNDSYGATRTESNPADFDQYNLLFKVRQELEGGHKIGVTAERFRRDLDTDLRELQGPGRTYQIGDYDGRELRQRDRISLDYDYEAVSSDAFFTAARATVYWQRLKKESGTDGSTSLGVAYGRNNEIENDTWGFNGSVTKDFDAGNLSHSVRASLETAKSDWSQYSFGLCPTPTTCPMLNNQAEVPDVDSTTLGFTIEDEIDFGNNFALTPGLRFDWFNYKPSTGGGFASNPGLPIFGPVKDRQESQFSPKLLASYDITPDVQVYAQWAMAFRAPTIDELYSRFYNPMGNYAQLGNPDLKPETGNGFEVGSTFDVGDMTGRVSAFHNRYKNFIETETTINPTTGIMEFNYENVNDATISGIELAAAKTFDNGVNLHASLAYASGKRGDTDQRLRSVAPFKAIIGGGWSNEVFGFDLSSTLSAHMPDDGAATNADGSDTTFDAPGYGIVDFTTWWTPTQAEGLRIQAGVYNVFDKEYYSALAVRSVNLGLSSSQPQQWYSEPGRTFKISLTQRF